MVGYGKGYGIIRDICVLYIISFFCDILVVFWFVFDEEIK